MDDQEKTRLALELIAEGCTMLGWSVVSEDLEDSEYVDYLIIGREESLKKILSKLEPWYDC